MARSAPKDGEVPARPAGPWSRVGAWLGASRYRGLLYGALAFVAAGVGAMWGLGAVGGLGGDTGRSYGWAALVLPYPIGWVAGLVGAIHRLREPADPPAG